MSIVAKQTLPARVEAEGAPPPDVYRFTIEQYERMAEKGILTPEDHAEYLEGWIVKKMTQYPPHAVTIDLVADTLRPLLPEGWRLRDQKPIVTPESLPEPDVALVRGPISRYFERHPQPRDVAVVIEVAETTLQEDRERKGRIYARVKIPIYWIVNLPNDCVEVYTRPRAGRTPGYRERQDYGRKDAIPLIIEGHETAQVPVEALLPPRANSR